LPEVTAWICANDLAGICALDYLGKHRRPVPRTISVAGFDNLSAAAVENRLTSFDFNTAGVIYRALDFIVRPPKPRPGYRHFPIEVEGIVMERNTTGPAVKRSA
jgi:DNA-binding LacI/PurR family transcriptional regulator